MNSTKKVEKYSKKSINYIGKNTTHTKKNVISKDSKVNADAYQDEFSVSFAWDHHESEQKKFNHSKIDFDVVFSRVRVITHLLFTTHNCE